MLRPKRLPVAVVKYDGGELLRCLHQLSCRIRPNEGMTDDLNLSKYILKVWYTSFTVVYVVYRVMILLNIV